MRATSFIGSGAPLAAVVALSRRAAASCRPRNCRQNVNNNLTRLMRRASFPSASPSRATWARHVASSSSSVTSAGTASSSITDEANAAAAAAAPTQPTAETKRSVMFVSFLWPESSSSAAGVRTTSLLRAFQTWGWNVHYLACARPNAHTESLEAEGITTYHVSPNRGERFEAALLAAAPDAVVFDRFMSEEAFSFRVRAAVPSAARILDMQDLHSLRYARQAAVKDGLAAEQAAAKATKKTKKKKNQQGGSILVPSSSSLVEVALAAVPSAEDDHLARELAAVHRSDLTLVCSPVEIRLMRDRFQVPSDKLVLASFFCDTSATVLEDQPPRPSGGGGGGDGNDNNDDEGGFDTRSGFMTIGTFYHPPNVDSVRWMATEVWPLIRAELGPDAEIRVYGAYPTEAIKQLHRPEHGFRIEGFAPTVEGAMNSARVLLAPLRFGAGIKGKIVDAWSNGLPVVTTPVGAEGMVPGVDQLWEPPMTAAAAAAAAAAAGESHHQWGGRWTSTDAAGIARDAVALHENRVEWERAREAGTRLNAELFPADRNLTVVREAVEGLFLPTSSTKETTTTTTTTTTGATTTRLEKRRSVDFYGGALWHHSIRSTEYFSRWIEVKETGADSSAYAPEGLPVTTSKLGVAEGDEEIKERADDE